MAQFLSLKFVIFIQNLRSLVLCERSSLQKVHYIIFCPTMGNKFLLFFVATNLNFYSFLDLDSRKDAPSSIKNFKNQGICRKNLQYQELYISKTNQNVINIRQFYVGNPYTFWLSIAYGYFYKNVVNSISYDDNGSMEQQLHTYWFKQTKYPAINTKIQSFTTCKEKDA